MSNLRFNTILWDMDGTIVDSRLRLYSLFIELTGSDISFDKYWEMKAMGFNQKRMLIEIGYVGDTDIFHTKWLINVERKDLIEKDTLIDNVHELLAYASERGFLMYVITNRQNIEILKYELRYLQINKYFIDVYSTYQKCKKDKILKSLGLNMEYTLYIGDSREDMEASEKLGIKFMYVGIEPIEGRMRYTHREYDEIRQFLI